MAKIDYIDFDLDTKKGVREAYGEALVELGKIRDNVVVLDADLSESTRTSYFAKAFPNRFFDVGVAEQDLIGISAGLSLTGKIVFASSFALFATGRPWEIIRNSIAYPALNVKIAASHGGISVGEDGASHQANEDVALMRIIPNMTVVVPADAVEMRKVVLAAAEYDGPMYIRSSRMKFPKIFNEKYEFEIGKAQILKEGSDLTIFATGIMAANSIVAARLLEKQGISARVVNMSTIKPIDIQMIKKCAEETGAFVTAEEHSIIGGLGGAVSEIAGAYCPVPIRRVGIADEFGQSGTPAELFKFYKLLPEDIVLAAKQVLKHKKEK